MEWNGNFSCSLVNFWRAGMAERCKVGHSAVFRYEMIQVGYARLQVVNGRPADMFLKKLSGILAQAGFSYFRSNGPIEVAMVYRSSGLRDT